MSKPHEHTNKLERGRKTAISENVIIDFIVLEKGIFLKPFKALQIRHYFRLRKPNSSRGWFNTVARKSLELPQWYFLANACLTSDNWG
jgi:hypothetical protein